MNYIHKLKLQNVETWQAVIAQTVEEYEQPVQWLTKAMTIVEIGVIIKPATFDEEGNQLTPETIVEGWHVDILANSLIEELREYCLDHAPANPQHGYDWADRPAMLVLKVGEVYL